MQAVATPSITTHIDNTTHLKGEYATSARPPAPISCKIEVTRACNYRCAFCSTGNSKRPNDSEMDKDLYFRLVREMREAGVKELGVFFLGESLICPWLPEAVDYAKNKMGYERVFLTTNGSLADEKHIKPLFEAGLDSLKFSMNYSDRDQFANVARVKGSLFDKMMTNIKNAPAIRDEVYARTGRHCGLFASYIKYDDAQMIKMLPIIDEFGKDLDEVYALPLYSMAMFRDQMAERMGGAMPRAGNCGRLAAPVPMLPCWQTQTEAHILYTGELSSCAFGHTKDFVMADLREVSFMDGWHSDKFVELREHLLRKEVKGTVCEHCALWN